MYLIVSLKIGIIIPFNDRYTIVQQIMNYMELDLFSTKYE